MGRSKKEIDSSKVNDGKFYKPEEDAFILREYGKSDTGEIAEALGRSRQAIVARASRITKDIKVEIVEPDGYKHCKRCDTIKPYEDFYAKKGSKYGRYSICKECDIAAAKKKRLEKKIQDALEKSNILKEQEELRLATIEKNKQSYVCRICGEEKPGEVYTFYKNLVVDNRCKKCRVELDKQNTVKRIVNGVDW